VQVRLQKILSGAGVASRRAAEQLMREGRISVNGQTVLDPGVKADPEKDDVRVDGRRIKAQQARYILLNKPKGYITTRSDPARRPTVLSLLAGVREYVYPVGRLDYDSEGLLRGMKWRASTRPACAAFPTPAPSNGSREASSSTNAAPPPPKCASSANSTKANTTSASSK
jgi:23S rRNA-/tRNA-specific pseudouridylate synthase